jgi:hypothetical protein
MDRTAGRNSAIGVVDIVPVDNHNLATARTT